jgi:restriction system protein
MSVPDFQSLMLPVLRATSGGVISASQLRAAVAQDQGLTDEDLEELLPSGRQTVFANRVAWANVFLQRAGLVKSVRRGHYEITGEGRSALAASPARIDMAYLNRYPGYREWRAASTNRGEPTAAPPEQALVSHETSSETPEEVMEATHSALNRQLAVDLLERLREVSPGLFERMMVDLLLAMKYGGGRAEMGQALGRSGDGGIDGLINEDELGLDAVYVQAKRYAASNSVGEPEIRGFVGALEGHRATKGVFVTTSSFTKSARDYAERVQKRLILIDGTRLASLMVQHGVGVRVRAVYEVKGVDEEFFEE